MKTERVPGPVRIRFIFTTFIIIYSKVGGKRSSEKTALLGTAA